MGEAQWTLELASPITQYLCFIRFEGFLLLIDLKRHSVFPMLGDSVLPL